MDSLKPVAWSAPLFTAGVGLSAFASGSLATLSLVTIPVVLTNPTNATLLNGWRQTLLYAFNVCPPLCAAGSVAHFLNAYVHRDSPAGRARYLTAAAVSTIGIVPFTRLFLVSLNQELFRREEAARGTVADVDASSAELIRKWSRLNLVRAGLPAVGALIACYALLV